LALSSAKKLQGTRESHNEPLRRFENYRNARKGVGDGREKENVPLFGDAGGGVSEEDVLRNAPCDDDLRLSIFCLSLWPGKGECPLFIGLSVVHCAKSQVKA